MLCPVNLPNEEKLAGREKLARGGSQDKEKLLTNASSPSQAVDVQQLIRCQIARSIHYTTSAIIVRLPKQPSTKFTSTTTIVHKGAYYTSTRNRMEERLHSYYNFKM